MAAAAFAGGGENGEVVGKRGLRRSGTGAVLSLLFLARKTFLEVLCWYGLALFVV